MRAPTVILCKEERHETKRAATAAAAKRNQPGRLVAQYCPWCDGYHVTRVSRAQLHRRNARARKRYAERSGR